MRVLRLILIQAKIVQVEVIQKVYIISLSSDIYNVFRTKVVGAGGGIHVKVLEKWLRLGL